MIIGAMLLLAAQAGPAPAVLEITAKGCKVKLDSKRVALGDLRGRIHMLGAEGRALQLRPEPGVTADCLVKVTNAIRGAHP